jgi:hypothetical protein
MAAILLLEECSASVPSALIVGLDDQKWLRPNFAPWQWCRCTPVGGFLYCRPPLVKSSLYEVSTQIMEDPAPERGRAAALTSVNGGGDVCQRQ